MRGIPLNWFRSYLSNRKQFVQISGVRSEIAESKCGVPQGSILGPLLFLVYINDMAQDIPLAKTILYADDTTLLFSGSKDNLIERSKESIASFRDWLNTNKLILNEDKTVFLQFLSKNKAPIPIHFDDISINESFSVKFLGLTIDNSLNWSSHISNICCKLSRTCFALRTLRPLLDTERLLYVYHGCFSSVMSYGIEVWGGSVHAFRVFLEQKRAIRNIQGLPPLSSCRGVFKNLKLLTLPSLYIYKVLAAFTSSTSKPQSVGENHRYPTRRGADLRTSRHRLTLFERDITHAGAVFFNKLPTEIRLKSGRPFLKQLKCFLLEHEFYHVKDFLQA